MTVSGVSSARKKVTSKAHAIKELVVFKDGSSINGEVLVKRFVLNLKHGTFALPESDILSVEYKHPPHTDDQVYVSAETKLLGDLTLIVPSHHWSTTWNAA